MRHYTWHKEEQDRLSTLSSDSLRYTAKDCREAIYANPANPKNSDYADTAHYCSMELRKRSEQ